MHEALMLLPYSGAGGGSDAAGGDREAVPDRLAAVQGALVGGVFGEDSQGKSDPHTVTTVWANVSGTFRYRAIIFN